MCGSCERSVKKEPGSNDAKINSSLDDIYSSISKTLTWSFYNVKLKTL